VRGELVAFILRIELSSTVETPLYTEREEVPTVHVLEFQINARD